MDFQEVRQYQPGDDARQIDWRVTAKYGKPYTKLYTDEKLHSVFIITDARREMKFASRGAFKSVIAAKITAFVLWKAFQNKDRVGIEMLMPDKIEAHPFLKNESEVFSVFKTLEDLQNPATFNKSRYSLQDALDKAGKIIRAGSLVFIISDFHDLDDGTAQKIKRLRVKNTVILVHIFDAAEVSLPPGSYPISDGEAISVLNLQDKESRAAYADQFTQHLEMLKKIAHGENAGYVGIATDENATDKINAYLHRSGYGS